MCESSSSNSKFVILAHSWLMAEALTTKNTSQMAESAFSLLSAETMPHIKALKATANISRATVSDTDCGVV